MSIVLSRIIQGRRRPACCTQTPVSIFRDRSVRSVCWLLNDVSLKNWFSGAVIVRPWTRLRRPYSPLELLQLPVSIFGGVQTFPQPAVSSPLSSCSREGRAYACLCVVRTLCTLHRVKEPTHILSNNYVLSSWWQQRLKSESRSCLLGK